MEQLDSLDAAFIYLETKNAPMHIGSVQIYEGIAAEFDFSHYREAIRSRLNTSPVFRRRAVPVPMNLGRPYWVEDPNFDLDMHLEHISLPRPGGWRQLRDLAQDRFSAPLDPNRPLWSMTFVEGVDGMPELPSGAFAVITKIHHAAADGMGSVDLFSALWDPTPDGRPAPEDDDWHPEALPRRAGLITRSLRHLVGQPAAFARSASALAKGSFIIGKDLFSGGRVSSRLLFTAPRTRFNQPIETQRSFSGISLSLNGIKAIKNRVQGTTINDVVLAVCAGGLRGYLGDKNELPDKPLVAMAPISVRGAVTGGGNQVSAMLVSLETDEPDGMRRLKLIHQRTLDSKAYAQAIGASTLMDSTQVVPFSLGTAAARFYSRMHVARLHRPPFNIIITNVPGPRGKLFLGGAKLLNVFGMAPVIDGLGAIMVITSYDTHLTISINASRHLLPDIDLLLGHLRAAYRELSRGVAGLPRVDRRRKTNSRRKGSTRRKPVQRQRAEA